MEQSSGADFYTISGVNPETMGSMDSPASMSGVAIDRRQGAAFTQISDLAEESNYSEQLIIDRLWGSKGRPGLIPQYFTEAQVMRIIGDDDEQQFVNVAPGQPSAINPQQDPMTGEVQKVLYDLSKFEFDIKVEPDRMTPTLMQSTLFQLIDYQKSGGQVPPEMILEYMPINNKAELKKMIQQQAQMQKPEPPKTSLTINFKDLPVEAQAGILAAEGLQVAPQSIMQQKMLDMEMKNKHQQGANPQG